MYCTEHKKVMTKCKNEVCNTYICLTCTKEVELCNSCRKEQRNSIFNLIICLVGVVITFMYSVFSDYGIIAYIVIAIIGIILFTGIYYFFKKIELNHLIRIIITVIITFIFICIIYLVLKKTIDNGATDEGNYTPTISTLEPTPSKIVDNSTPTPMPTTPTPSPSSIPIPENVYYEYPMVPDFGYYFNDYFVLYDYKETHISKGEWKLLNVFRYVTTNANIKNDITSFIEIMEDIGFVQDLSWGTTIGFEDESFELIGNYLWNDSETSFTMVSIAIIENQNKISIAIYKIAIDNIQKDIVKYPYSNIPDFGYYFENYNTINDNIVIGCEYLPQELNKAKSLSNITDYFKILEESGFIPIETLEDINNIAYAWSRNRVKIVVQMCKCCGRIFIWIIE